MLITKVPEDDYGGTISVGDEVATEETLEV
jgi:hypothetical protein